MKKLIPFLLSLLFGICLSVFVYNLVGWQEIKNAFVNFGLVQGLVILILTLLISILGAKRWQEILKGGGANISFFDVFKSYLAGFSVIFFAPVLFLGGEILRVYTLKEKHSIVWVKGISSIIIDRVLEWSVNLAAIILGTFYFIGKINLFPLSYVVLFGIALSFFIIIIILFYLRVFKKKSMIAFLGNAFNGDLNGEPQEIEGEIFTFFNAKKGIMWRALILSVIRMLVMYVRVLFLMMFLGESTAVHYVLPVLSFSLLAATVPIPAAAGAHELAQWIAFKSLGLRVSLSTAFAIILRSAEAIVALIGLLILSRLGFDLLKNRLFKTTDKLNDAK